MNSNSSLRMSNPYRVIDRRTKETIWEYVQQPETMPKDMVLVFNEGVGMSQNGSKIPEINIELKKLESHMKLVLA